MSFGRLARTATWRGTTQETGAVQPALDAIIAAEAASVTFVGAARERGASGELDLGPAVVRFLRASQCEDEAHYHFLESLGAVPAATTFSVPRDGLGDRISFLRALIDLEAICVGAYMAAARRFAEVGELRLVEVAYQIGAVDAQHLALYRYFMDVVPAADRAFARWRFVDAVEVGSALVEAGFLDGSGETVSFPGPVDRICEGVFGLVPETTDDMLNAPPAVVTRPPATSDATPDATPTAASSLIGDIEGGLDLEDEAAPVP